MSACRSASRISWRKRFQRRSRSSSEKVGMIGFSSATFDPLLIGFDAAVEARQSSAEFFSVLLCSLPFFFVGNERPVFFAEGGDLQLVGIRVGEIDASFSRRAQAVFGAKVALIGAAAGGN